jgi:hypothetical protein
MKKWTMLSIAILLCLSLPRFSFPQVQELSFSEGFKIIPGARVEYFARTLTWDEEKYTSELKSTLFALSLEMQIDEGFSISALVGYALSNCESLVFRSLPFSIELDVGEIGGYIVGVEARKSLIRSDSLELGVNGQFVYQIGKEKIWDIPGLSVSGTLTGKPTWMRAIAGPYLKFTNLGSIAPYLSVCYNNLWGDFEMKQVIQTLEGTELKKINSKGLIDITLGSVISLSRNFFLRGEVHGVPNGNGMDLGFVAIVAFSF